jgi:hypothetical protein
VKKLRGFHRENKEIALGAAARTLSCNLSRDLLRPKVGVRARQAADGGPRGERFPLTLRAPTPATSCDAEIVPSRKGGVSDCAEPASDMLLR